MRLRGKFVLIGIIPMIVVTMASVAFAGIKAESAIKNEIVTGLKSTAYCMRDDVSSTDGNSYWVDTEGNLWNGSDYNVTEDTEGIDDLYNEVGIAVTIFYGDTRYSTSVKDNSGNRILGTQAAPEVVAEVLNKGNEYYASNASVNGVPYFAYYIPMYDEGTPSPVGMIFAGKPSSIVKQEVMSLAFGCILMCVIASVVVVFIVSALAIKLSKRFEKEVVALNSIADGDLTVALDKTIESNPDESGDIARSLSELKEKLTNIIGSIQSQSKDVAVLSTTLDDDCEQSARNIETVENAVTEIATCATSQATETTNASEQVITMGQLVENTSDTVDRLNAESDKMEASGAEASATLTKLLDVSKKAKSSMDIIYDQTNTANRSAQMISEAVSLITSISEETNLLSLNASIEAARAGEQGRGFSVVAAQISKLAEQSSESAHRIEEIVNVLITDSQKAVDTMDEVKEIMDTQSEMVVETGERFEEVMTGINSSRAAAKDILGIMSELNGTRQKVVDIVSNLSAIAEENAASSEETSASLTMVGSSIQEMAAQAIKLKEIADSLDESVNSFKLAN